MQRAYDAGQMLEVRTIRPIFDQEQSLYLQSRLYHINIDILYIRTAPQNPGNCWLSNSERFPTDVHKLDGLTQGLGHALKEADLMRDKNGFVRICQRVNTKDADHSPLVIFKRQSDERTVSSLKEIMNN